MTWKSLSAVRSSTKLEFAPWLAARHVFVRLGDGRWTRVLGAPPADAVRVYGRVYHVKRERESK